MQISNIQFSSDKKSIELTITDAASVTDLRLWTEVTYKDYSKAIDLSGKLTGSTTENITINLSDISQTVFDGVYFIEAEDDDELSIEYVWEISKYKECILNEVLELTSCKECMESENLDLINAATTIKGLEYALELRFIDEIILFTDVLNKYCSNECQSCGENSNVENISSGEILNPDDITLNITLDGGSSTT